MCTWDYRGTAMDKTSPCSGLGGQLPRLSYRYTAGGCEMQQESRVISARAHTVFAARRAAVLYMCSKKNSERNLGRRAHLRQRVSGLSSVLTRIPRERRGSKKIRVVRCCASGGGGAPTSHMRRRPAPRAGPGGGAVCVHWSPHCGDQILVSATSRAMPHHTVDATSCAMPRVTPEPLLHSR